MSEDQPQIFTSFAEREMFIRKIMAESRIEDREFLEFVNRLPPAINEGLGVISAESEILFEPKYKALISTIWAEQKNRHIQEVCDNVYDAWLEYIFGPDVSQTAGNIRQQIIDLFVTHDIEHNEAQLDHIVSDMLLFAECRLSLNLFAPHLRREGIPEAAIRLLYPVLGSSSAAENVGRKIDAGGFYLEPTRKGNSEATRSNVVSLCDFKPKG